MTRGSSAALASLFALCACSSADRADQAADGSGLSTDEAVATDDGEETQSDVDTEGAETEELLDVGGQPLADCDPWAQDCPAGEKCSWEQVEGVAKTRCVPLERDPKPPGQPCTVFGDRNSGYDDCGLGAMCSHVDADNQGVCKSLCAGSPAEPTCEEQFAVCQICPDCPSLCLPICDPLASDCPEGFACTPNAGSLTCQPSDQLGTGTVGDPCEYAFQCAAGHACVDATKLTGCEATGCCSPFCDLGDPSCPDALTCTPWFAIDDPPLPDLGVCGSG